MRLSTIFDRFNKHSSSQLHFQFIPLIIHFVFICTVTIREMLCSSPKFQLQAQWHNACASKLMRPLLSCFNDKFIHMGIYTITQQCVERQLELFTKEANLQAVLQLGSVGNCRFPSATYPAEHFQRQTPHKNRLRVQLIYQT